MTTSSRDSAPEGEGWLHEIKWDCYRMMADLVAGKVKLRSRGELDWTATFPEIAQAVEALPGVAGAEFIFGPPPAEAGNGSGRQRAAEMG